MKPYLIVSVGAMDNAIIERKMLDIGKVGRSILTTSFYLYFLKLHSSNYILSPLIKRRNRGVIFLFLYSLHSFPVIFGENPRPGVSVITLQNVVRYGLAQIKGE